MRKCRNTSRAKEEHFFWSGFESKNGEIVLISRKFQSNPGGFLYISDFVVERRVWP